MKTKSPKIFIVMPAYNAEKTLVDTYKEIPRQLRNNIILVDDKSADDTVKIAKKLGLTVIQHRQNLGYGGNQKTCYKTALKMGADVVAMLHPDYQYSALYLPQLVEPIVSHKYDFMFGSRVTTRQNALDGGMPKLKYFTNRFFCVLQNILLGVNFSEHFSGFRAYSAKLLSTVPYQHFSNDFLFDIQMTISSLSYKFRVGEIPIPTRYEERSSKMNLRKGIKLILSIASTLFIYELHQSKFITSKLYAPRQ